MNEDEILKKAEEAIRAILIEVQTDTGKDIASVRVDTRNFANLSTQIFLE